MPFLIVLLTMQYVVSVKAGLVNNVEGTANVAEMEMARLGRPVRTAADGYVEMLLTPGSFLRIGENSEVVLDSVELSNVRLTLVKGPAVIEVLQISRNTPIQVTTGNLTTRIINSGIYKFSDGVATVIQGKLHTADSSLAYEKGWQLFFQDNYRARKLAKIPATSLDLYSEIRSEQIAQANYSLASQMQNSFDYDYWFYAPHIGMYTYIPRSNFRSPYGFRYYGVGRAPVVARVGSYSPSGGSSGGGTTLNTGNSSSNNNSNSSSGDGGGGGGAPAITVTTPGGERSAPAVYIEGKSSSNGATQ
jgi:hypothetical protein